MKLLAIIEAATITGPAKNLLQFAVMARGQGVDVSLVVFQRPNQPDLFLQTARRSSLPVYPIPEKGRFDPTVIGALSDVVGQLRPDVIQSHAVKSHFLVRQSGLGRIAPWVAFHHGYTWPDLRARLYNQLDRWSLRAADRVLTVSLPFRDQLVGKGVNRNRIEVIHNAIDPQWGRAARDPQAAAALRARLGIPPTRKVILIVGRLSREKDHISLLHAVNQLRDLDPHLLVVGDGPERAPIEAAIAQLGLGEAVTLTGQVPSAEPYYGIANIAVLSSLSEGSPNALLEAMAAGVPVVATKVGGVPEIATHGETALLIPPSDPKALSASIRDLIVNPRRAEDLASHAYDVVLTRHTPEARTAHLIKLYAGVVSSQER